jgi:hypothetical protein
MHLHLNQKSGRCGVSPLDGVATNALAVAVAVAVAVVARGKLFPYISKLKGRYFSL